MIYRSPFDLCWFNLHVASLICIRKLVTHNYYYINFLKNHNDNKGE